MIPTVRSLARLPGDVRVREMRQGQFDRVFDAIRRAGAAKDAACGFFVPGRIEVLGKHTDYAGGRSLLCAMERGFALASAPRNDRCVHVVNADTGESVTCEIDPDLTPRVGTWTGYPLTVVRRLARNFPSFECGATLAFTSDLPPAAGLSSSSALLVAVYLGLAEVNGLDGQRLFKEAIGTREELAGYLAAIENGRSFGPLDGDTGVGTFGGSEDHTAILCCREGHLAQYAFSPARLERQVRLAEDLVFVVADCGIEARKTGNARERYNRASRLAARVAEIWRCARGQHASALGNAVDSGGRACEQIRAVLREAGDAEFSARELLERFEQFSVESGELVPAASDALERGDLTHFGLLVDRSQQAAEAWLHNQIPETIALAALARQQGALAASAFGAGFGGSVWALVPDADRRRFAEGWKGAYVARFRGHATRARFLSTRPGPAAYRLEWRT
ncbi:MAG: galactokinase family protein [Acidobacteriota bacterium]